LALAALAGLKKGLWLHRAITVFFQLSHQLAVGAGVEAMLLQILPVLVVLVAAPAGAKGLAAALLGQQTKVLVAVEDLKAVAVEQIQAAVAVEAREGQE
jgi:hypothetical protein